MTERVMPPGFPDHWYKSNADPNLKIELENLHKFKEFVQQRQFKCPKCECPLVKPVSLVAFDYQVECINCGHQYRHPQGAA